MSEQGKTQKFMKKKVAPAIVVVAIAAISALAFIDGSSSKASTNSTSSSSTASQSTQPISLARRIADDPLAVGRLDAPVVLIEYSEFQCPFCGLFSRNTQPVLIKKYVANGTLRIEWRDFPYLGPESTTAAIAGRAAANQGKFWQYHDALFAHQFFPNSDHLTQAYLTNIAKKLGLNLSRFTADLSNPATKYAVEKDFTEGQSIGVTGTPSFLVNATPIVGAQPLNVFENAIDIAAAQATAKAQ